MSLNPNWEKWIFGSVSKYFEGALPTYQMYVEGEHRELVIQKDTLELRLDGPYYTEESNNYWRLDIEISILVQAVQDDLNSMRIRQICGQVAAAYISIPVFRFGLDTLTDDSTLLGCLVLKQNQRTKDRIQTNHFGLISPDTKIMQSTVEGHYYIHLSN